MKNCYRPVKELKREQDRKVRWFVRHAYDHVPLYHDWMRSRGLSPSDIQIAEDLRHLPLLTKEDIRTNFPNRLRARNRNWDRVITRSTSGTTGLPAKIMKDAKHCDILSALKLRSMHMLGVKPWEKFVDITYIGPTTSSTEDTHKKGTFMRKFKKLIIGPMHLRWPGLRVTILGLTPNNLDYIAQSLYRLKPKIIRARPSYLRRLGHLLRDSGKPVTAQKVFTSGEFVSKACRHELRDLFRADVFERYGITEMGSLGCECLEHSGVHLHSDYYFFEFLRDGEQVSPGEAGEVIITGLLDETMPLIRYRLGDIAVCESDRCGCGSNLLKLRSIQGRKDDGLISKDHIRIPPGPIIDYMENVMGFFDYQLIQKDYQKVLLKIKKQHSSKQAIEALSNYLKGLLGPDLTMEVEICEKDFPVKYRPVISQIN